MTLTPELRVARQSSRLEPHTSDQAERRCTDGVWITNGSRPSVRRQLSVAVAILMLFYVFSPNRIDTGGDPYLVVPTAHSLLYEGNLDLAEFSHTGWYREHYAQVTVNGRSVDYFPWLTSALTVPMIAIWDLSNSIIGGRTSGELIADGNFISIQAIYAALLSALAAAALGLLTRQLFLMSSAASASTSATLRLPRRLVPWQLTLSTLILGLATSLWSIASRALWQHAPSILLGALAMLALLKLINDEHARHHALLAAGCGALLAAAYWVRPVNMVLSLVAICLLAALKRTELKLLGLGLLAVHGGMVLLNELWLGSPWPPYFSGKRIEVHGELLNAAAVNIVSPARGLIVFSPFVLGALLLVVPSRRRCLGTKLSLYLFVSLAGVCAYLLSVSAYAENWWAGHSFGPRFMSETLILLGPLTLLGLFGPNADQSTLSRLRPTLGCVLIAVSVAVHFGGAALGGAECWNLTPTSVDDAPSRVWSLRDAQVLSGYTRALRHSGDVPTGYGCQM